MPDQGEPILQLPIQESKESGTSSGRSVNELISGITTDGLASLSEIMGANRFKAEEVDRAIQENTRELGRKDPEGFISSLAELSEFEPRVKDAIKVLKRQTVVDLGAGEFSYGYEIAARAGANSYVGVEPYFAGALSHSIEEASKKEVNAIPFCVVRDHLLDFLKRLPSDSVSILVSGIAGEIIKSDYADKVREEIRRVLHPDGGCVLFCSEVLEQEEHGIFEEDILPGEMEFKVVTKRPYKALILEKSME